MNRQQLNKVETVALRDQGLLDANEFAYRAGDLVVAENVLTGEKRVLGESAKVLSETSKRVLKG